MTSSPENAARHAEALAVDPYPSTPGLWPIRAAANYAGLSVNGLQAGISDGTIPVLIRRVGASGKRYVNVAQLVAWVQFAPVPEPEDLF